jgi:hypothetical protein
LASDLRVVVAVISATAGGLQDVYGRKLSSGVSFMERVETYFAVAGEVNLVLLITMEQR